VPNSSPGETYAPNANPGVTYAPNASPGKTQYYPNTSPGGLYSTNASPGVSYAPNTSPGMTQNTAAPTNPFDAFPMQPSPTASPVMNYDYATYQTSNNNAFGEPSYINPSPGSSYQPYANNGRQIHRPPRSFRLSKYLIRRPPIMAFPATW
jgi:hypothetical protein